MHRFLSDIMMMKTIYTKLIKYTTPFFQRLIKRLLLIIVLLDPIFRLYFSANDNSIHCLSEILTLLIKTRF